MPRARRNSVTVKAHNDQYNRAMIRLKSNRPIVIGSLLALLVFLAYFVRQDEGSREYMKTLHERARGLGQVAGEQQGKLDAHIDLTSHVPRTVRQAGIWGYNVFDNLYISEGGYIAVSDDSEGIPPEAEVIGQGATTFKRIGMDEAVDDLGEVVGRLPGTTFIFNDPPGGNGYMIYHNNFVSELFTGAWKILSLAPPLDPSTSLDYGEDSPTPTRRLNKMQSGRLADLPSRWMFPKCSDAETWVDDKNQNVWLLSNIAPEAAMEEEGAWRLRGQAGMTVMMERAVIVDRRSAHAGHGKVDIWGKMNAEVAQLPARLDFMDPIRERMIAALRIEVEPVEKPVVVYFDNQGEGRRLLEEDHDALIAALKGLTDVAEVHVSKLKNMDIATRIGLLSRASVIISVHQDILINSMWMPATHTSSIMEIFDEGGFAPDWWLYGNLLGHTHYPIHKDRVFKKPEKRVETEGFHGSGIRLDAKFLTELVREVLVNPVGKGEEVEEFDL